MAVKCECYCEGFDVFIAVVLKSIFFWDMTPCSALSGTRRFGGTYRLHLQGRRIIQQSSELLLFSGGLTPCSLVGNYQCFGGTCGHLIQNIP
jgi:hypothetical protein